MQRIGFLMVLGLAWLAAGSSRAQVREGDVRLYLDAALLSWAKEVTEVEVAGTSEKTDTTVISSGLLAGGGVGVGYAATPYLVPELYVSLQNAKVAGDGDGDGELTLRQWELRPCLEVPLLPRERFVPFLMGGMTLGRSVSKGDTEFTMFGLGPVLGVGAHAFLTQHASLDLGLAFRGTFYVQNDLEDTLLAGLDAKTRQYALLLTLGASFWL